MFINFNKRTKLIKVFIIELFILLVLVVKNPPANAGTQETWVQSLRREDRLEEEMATHSNSCLENPMDRGAWWSTVHGITKSRTQLERPSAHILQRNLGMECMGTLHYLCNFSGNLKLF